MRKLVPPFIARTTLQCLTLLVIACCADQSRAQSHFSDSPRTRSLPATQPADQPAGMQSHPSIVRVVAEANNAQSRGSGTLIGVDEEHGYVLTNWHVVRDATGRVIVQFPDGFESAATVMKTDDTWDLALLVIWRPSANPMPLSPNPPQPGESLIIAGYGQGPFRAANGQFTDHASPHPTAPFDMFEVSVAARQGDSGGPIVNQRGELAGVLFGTGGGMTTGTKVDRVRTFLDQAFLPDVAGSPTAGAYSALPHVSSPANQQAAALRVNANPEASSAAPQHDSLSRHDLLAGIPPAAQAERNSQISSGDMGVSDYVGKSPMDQVKTFLAVIGVFAIILQLLPR